MAISLVETTYANGATSVAFTNPVAAGDVIVVAAMWDASDTFTFSDSVNGSGYTVHPSSPFHITVDAYGYVVYGLIKATASGTPTVSLGGTHGQRLGLYHYTGFTGTPTFIAPDVKQAEGSGTAWNSGSFNTTQAGEICLAAVHSAGGQTPTDPLAIFGNSWNGGNQLRLYESTNTGPITLGTAVSVSGTFGVSDTWYAAVIGLYDAPASSASAVPFRGQAQVFVNDVMIQF